MKSCFAFALVLACVCLCANAQEQESLTFWPSPGSTCSKAEVSCSSSIDCFKSCRSLNYVCVGCPKCTNSPDLNGKCVLKGSLAAQKPPFCLFPNPDCGEPTPPPPPPPVCGTNTKCSTDADCIGCGIGSTCQGCNTGCPDADVPACLPKGEFKICPAVICEPQEPPCKLAGCSSELCVDSSAEDIATICIFRPEFVCFRDAECGKFGPNGGCAFKQTKELQKCLEENTQEPAILATADSGR